MTLKIKLDIQFYIFTFVFLCYSFVLVYTLAHPQIAFTGDAEEYVAAAHNIIENHVVYCGDYSGDIRYDLFSRRPPFYPLLIAIALQMDNSPLLILIFQMLLTFLGGILIFRILNYRNVPSSVKMLVIVSFLLYPSQIIFTNFIMSEIVLQFCLLLSFYCLLMYDKTRDVSFLLLYNFCLVIAVLTKPVMLYFGIVNILLHGWFYYKNRKKIILIFPLILLMVIGLWSYRNHQLTGVFHYSSIKNHNLLQYNVKGFLTKRYGVQEAEDIVAIIENTARRKLSYKEHDDFLQHESWKIINKHRWSYAIYHVTGIINFFLDPGRFEVYSFMQIKAAISFQKIFNEASVQRLYTMIRQMPIFIILYLGGMLIVNIILFISFIHFIYLSVKRCDYTIFILIVCAYIAVLTGPAGASRFRLSVLPLLVLTLPEFISTISQLRMVTKLKKFCKLSSNEVC